MLDEHDCRDDIDRLAELRHPQVDHQWTYHINSAKGTVLPPNTYRDALRHRLGCTFLPEADTRQCCKQALDVQCVRAGCCPKAQATQGHYAIARTVFQVAKTIDHSTTKEEVTTGEVTTGPDRLRPGDIVTGVIDGQRVAIDVGLTSQARRTPIDPVHQYAIDKVAKYRHLIDGEMWRAGLLFRAAIWSQKGRPGRDAREVVDGLSNLTHKYIPGTNKTDVRKRLTHEISVHCQIRIVNMINACIPPPSGQAAWICLGQDNNPLTNSPHTSDDDGDDGSS